MKKLYSYNQLVRLYGKEDSQVKKIGEYLKGISGNRIDSHNYSLEAFKRTQ